MRALALALAASLLWTACRVESSAPPQSAARERIAAGRVEVARVEGGVRITNGTARPIAYAVWNSGWLALFAPCVDPAPTCVRLAPGASVIIPDDEIGGYVPGAPEAIVRWWHVVPDGESGYRAEDVHEIVVRL